MTKHEVLKSYKITQKAALRRHQLKALINQESPWLILLALKQYDRSVGYELGNRIRNDINWIIKTYNLSSPTVRMRPQPI